MARSVSLGTSVPVLAVVNGVPIASSLDACDQLVKAQQ